MISREAFEAWCYQPIVTNAFDVDDSGEYRNATVRDRWATWQAACEWQKQQDVTFVEQIDYLVAAALKEEGELIMSPTVPKNEAEWWASREIESLRQRVKELEKKLVKAQDVPMKYKRMEFNAQLQNENERLEKELAALKAGQGEPVAWMWQHEETGKIGFTEVVQVTSGAHASLNPRLQLIAPLYTSAPNIPEGWQLNAREIELIDGMIDVQLSHAERCDKVQNRAMAEKQKGWDMERVELLRKIKSLAAAPKPEE